MPLIIRAASGPICTLLYAPKRQTKYSNAIITYAYLNLLQITAIISSTSTVIIAIVMMRFVAILHLVSISLSQTASTCAASTGARNSLRGRIYRLAIPLNVLILLSV